MAKYYLTNKAVDDLATIWDYTYDEWSESQADKYYLLLLNSCQEIAENPSLGKKYDNVTEKLLGFKSNQHIIFYQIISNKEVEIIRILHVRMDLKSKF
ncbi:plasmid stabilization protein [Flavobacterium piscis]|jgi:toxin ParE1/3/4|uniref:Toxin n=1 Tax=Flavobacterium piscis TaxID=1114874 RepID=A0ABX2XKC7_9FLAO|nr:MULTISPECIES: type II toxin-antitoxin system RelE/ParE family toxin [Flavobacterium]OCB74783.1 plasmid stabilization protein [Flavobacterium piscis]OXG05242.1 plasmid stabilization protein [Flavobacterium piscis]QDW22490.1 type II toxin-antitoxin system RelE/ParE family toxin [Flavobacterium sp. KBS0721]